jgi:hypothetical protein
MLIGCHRALLTAVAGVQKVQFLPFQGFSLAQLAATLRVEHLEQNL